MWKFVKECFWTKLIIHSDDSTFESSDLQILHTTIESFEQKYSRFIPGNFLDTLNKNKEALLDKELSSIVKFSLKVSTITKGYFDISVLPLLENIWYGTGKTYENPTTWYKNIQLTADRIILHNNISIEIGGIGKWYMVDKIYNILDARYKNFIINFGWDIRIKWKKTFFLEDPLDDTSRIWEILLENTSLASSNSRKRMTKKWHHLINPFEEEIDEKKAVFVTHKLSSFSDIFATALYVTPLKESLNILAKTQWLEWLIITENWEIYKSKWFTWELHI